MLSAVGLRGAALGKPFFSFLPYFKPGPARVSLGYRTSRDALALASGDRVTVLPPFMRNSPKALMPWGKLALSMWEISWFVLFTS